MVLPVNATDWMEVYRDKTLYAYVDRDELKPELAATYPMVTSWIQINYKQEQTFVRSRKFIAMMSQYSFNCTNRMVRTLQIYLYDRDGDLVEKTTIPGNLTAIAPNSASDAHYQYVCNWAKPRN
ncbi:MAG: hypothetical protein K2X66_15210 [Cyanobacteria bacterium]|nr:hypothetical protein [Cyanobacteriota bacterium]